MQLKGSGQSGCLPNTTDAIGIEYALVADDGEVFGLSLRNEHAIEGIAMRSGERSGTLTVFEGYSESLKAKPFYPGGYSSGKSGRSRQLADPNLGGDFPG